MRKPSRKLRTRAHVLADLSANHVERHCLRCGWAVERLRTDYGIDLELLTFNRKGEIDEGKILIQLKASDRLRLPSDARAFGFRLARSDLVHWLAEPMPVILIVYDAPKDVAYWLYVQHSFQELPDFNLFAAGRTVTVHVPTANVVTPAAVRRFGRFRDRILDQVGELTHGDD
jgi:hypothetical protein